MKNPRPSISDSNSSRPLDSRVLQAFVVVAHEGNVSRAAERLHLSQPAVSLQLKRLEELTGVQMFNRTASGLTLTRNGAALLPQAERALASVLEFSRSAMRVRGGVRGTLRVGTILDPEFTRLGAFLRELVAVAPEVEPQLQHGMSGTVAAQVAAGDLDVGYYLKDPQQDPVQLGSGSIDDVPTPDQRSLHLLPLTHFTYKVVAPPGWAPQVQGLDWAGLARLPWIGTPTASVHHRLLAGVYGPLGTLPDSVALVDQEASMLALVRSGVGLSLARDALAIRESQAHGLVVLDGLALDCALCLICLRSRRHEPLVQRAIHAAQKVWHQASADEFSDALHDWP